MSGKILQRIFVKDFVRSTFCVRLPDGETRYEVVCFDINFDLFIGWAFA